MPLGNGFGTVQVVNTDQGFILSNPQSELLLGDPADNIPTILTIDGMALSPADPSIPVAQVEVVVTPGAPLVLTGTGFNQPLVNLFTATGNLGPITPTSATTTQLTLMVPAGAAPGPASFQIVNAPYTGNVLSNAVSAVVGSHIQLDGVSQNGTRIAVTGAGFSALSVVNFFAFQGGTVVNFGGLDVSGVPRVPVVFVGPSRLTLTVPTGAESGPAFVQVLNPPFTPFSSTGSDPDGAFSLIAP